MLLGEDEDNTRSLQRETYEISSVLKEFLRNTNILVVDNNFINLLDMKKNLRQYAYQVTIEADAEKAFAFLTNCQHEINIVIWDFHMPGINGIQALKDIGSKMDIPVMIMSDDNQTESVMEATIHGACDYVMKPVREEIIANIWQHIVRKRVISKKIKMMSQPDSIPPVQSDLAQSDDLDKKKADSKILDQEQNIDRKYGRKQRRQRMIWSHELHQKFLDAIEVAGGIRRSSPNNIHKILKGMNIEGLTRYNVASHLQKHRLTIAGREIRQKRTAYRPTRGSRGSNNVTLKNDSNNVTLRNGSNNAQTAISSSYLMTGQAVNPIQQNQYQNSSLTMNNNQFITNQLPPLPYVDPCLYQHKHQQQKQLYQHQQQQQQYQPQQQPYQQHQQQYPPQQQPYQIQQQPYQIQQQQYQPSHQFNYVVSNEQPEQACGIGVTGLELTYPCVPPYDPFEHLMKGYSFN